MDQLRELVNSLNRAEIEIIRGSLRQFSSRKETTPSLQLFDIVLKYSRSKKNKLPYDNKLAQKIYGKKTSANRMSMLKERLKGKIVDFLLADANIIRPDVLDQADIALVKARKKLAQFQYLFYSKPTLSYSRILLDEVIELSREYELYSTLVEALKYKKWMGGLKQGIKEFDQQSRQVEFYDNCNRAVNKAADYYYKMIMISDFSANNNQEKYQSFIQKGLSDLQKDLADTQSIIIAYYIKVMEFAYYESKLDHLKSRSACLELIDIIRSNKSVFRKQRIGIAYHHISHCEIMLGNYKQAIEYAKLAQEHIIPGSANYTIAQEHEFLALFYDKQYKKAESISKNMLGSVNSDLGDFRYAKYRFYCANALFAQGKYKEASKILNEHLELSADKTGWDIALRTLAIMCCLELEDYDTASCMTDRLRKQIDRKSKDAPLKERDNAIANIIYQLSRNGFKYDSKNTKLISNTDLIRGKSKACAWEHFTPELIPFHQWLEKKYKTTKPKEKVLAE